MSIDTHQIEVDGLVVNVVQKAIKNLHLAVYPPDGRIRVAAPLRLDDEAVRLAVISRLGWIRRQQEKFKQQERQTAREYLSGESHYFQGARYRLNVIPRDAPSQVIVRNKQFIDLTVRPTSTTDQRHRIMMEWYRAYLKETIPNLIAKWEKEMGVTVADWGVKQMKTKWGTCNIEARRVWINLELAKKSSHCLEYIVVHEMVHLLERLHTDRFRALMNQYLPQWQLIRDELNREPLAHEDWEY
jgi:predicted metal-dependent hydrolase